LLVELSAKPTKETTGTDTPYATKSDTTTHAPN
jgi:hypothetical protein